MVPGKYPAWDIFKSVIDALLAKKKMKKKLTYMFTFPLSTIQGETIPVTEHNPT